MPQDNGNVQYESMNSNTRKKSVGAVERKFIRPSFVQVIIREFIVKE